MVMRKSAALRHGRYGEFVEDGGTDRARLRHSESGNGRAESMRKWIPCGSGFIEADVLR